MSVAPTQRRHPWQMLDERDAEPYERVVRYADKLPMPG